MRNKKLQVFVSSTFRDLKEERQAAVEAILTAGHIPAGMELFTAGDESQMDAIKRWIDDSDVFLLILGGKYGSVGKSLTKSYTQLEYEYALSRGKALFAVVVSDTGLHAKAARQPEISVIEEKYKIEYEEFRELVTGNRIVRFWDDKKDIKIAIHETLSEFSHRGELTGWVRGDQVVNSGLLAEEMARLTKDNAELRENASNVDEKRIQFFAGLTYDEMKSQLESEEVRFEGESMSLYNFMMRIAKHLIGWGLVLDDSDEKEVFDAFEKLKNNRLIYAPNGNKWIFTETGHNFVLRAKMETFKAHL